MRIHESGSQHCRWGGGGGGCRCTTSPSPHTDWPVTLTVDAKTTVHCSPSFSLEETFFAVVLFSPNALAPPLLLLLFLRSHFCIYILSCLHHPTSVYIFCLVSNVPLLYLHFILSPTSHFCIYILSCLKHPTSVSTFCSVSNIPFLYLHFVLSPTSHFLCPHFVLSQTSHFSVSAFCPVSSIPLLCLHFVLSPTSHFCVCIFSCLHHPTSVSIFCPVCTIPLLCFYFVLSPPPPPLYCGESPLCPLSPPPPFLHCFEQFRLHSQIQRLWDSLYVYDADCVGLLFDDSAKALPLPPPSLY